jgi:pyroglutamyl-peptidase
MNILLTGFEPFAGESINPSWQVAQVFDQQRFGSWQVHALELPCVFQESLQVIDRAIRALDPAIVISLGQAEGRSDISFERFAVNLDHARIADNKGNQPQEQMIEATGPTAYSTTLPIQRLAGCLTAAGIPASLSLSAGTFVCNHVFYHLQHQFQGASVRSGFIHLPVLPEQASRWKTGPVPSMTRETMTQALQLILTDLTDPS